jgi:hypothetical protein
MSEIQNHDLMNLLSEIIDKKLEKIVAKDKLQELIATNNKTSDAVQIINSKGQTLTAHEKKRLIHLGLEEKFKKKYPFFKIKRTQKVSI